MTPLLVGVIIMALIALGGEALLTSWGIAKQGGWLTGALVAAIAASIVLIIKEKRATSRKSKASSAGTKAVLPTTSRASAKTSPSAASNIESSASTRVVTMFRYGLPLAYYYENRDIALISDFIKDFRPVPLGEDIVFAPEPTNSYDPRAIRILCQGKMLGYVYRGRAQDMLHDWMERKDPYTAFISYVDDEAGVAKYNIAFYKAGSLSFVKKIGNAKSGRLVRSGSADAQDAIMSCEVGDELEVYYDGEKDCFEVESDYGLIGALPKGLSEMDVDNVQFFIEEINELDSGKLAVTVVGITSKQ